MSHVASVQCYVQDLKALEVVANRLGFDLVQGDTYKWYGVWVNDFRGGVAAVTNGHDPKNFGKCDGWKLRLKNARADDYEIGLVKRLDGKPGWELLYDNFSSYGARLHAKAGNNLVTLKNEIAAEVSTRTLTRQGYRVSRTVKPSGEILLTANK